jgi:hypothetical protein
MADHAAWAVGYARQSQADFQTFEKLQPMSVPECHKLQFLQMACEKLVKSHLCAGKSDPAELQTSHAYIAGTLPVVLRQQARFVNYDGPAARTTLRLAKLLASEIDVLAPAVTRNGSAPTTANTHGRMGLLSCTFLWTGRSRHRIFCFSTRDERRSN